MLAWLCLTLWQPSPSRWCKGCGGAMLDWVLQRKYAHFAAYPCTLPVLNAPITAPAHILRRARICEVGITVSEQRVQLGAAKHVHSCARRASRLHLVQAASGTSCILYKLHPPFQPLAPTLEKSLAQWEEPLTHCAQQQQLAS